MNEDNFYYLASQLKFTGFGETLQPALKVQLVQLTDEFVLYYSTEFGKDNLVATLHFRKSVGSDVYFFDRYNVLLKNEHHPDTVKQAFYISVNADNISLQEAYNLMCGRSVQKTITNKEGQKVVGWVQLDFKYVDKHGNFRLRQFQQPKLELLQEAGKTPLPGSLQRASRQQHLPK